MNDSVFVNVSQIWANWIFLVSVHLIWLTAIVAIVVALFRTSSARLRYGLLLIVLAKIFIPPVLWMSIGVAPGINESLQRWMNISTVVYGSVENESFKYSNSDLDAEQESLSYSLTTILMMAWLLGVTVYLAAIAAAYVRLRISLKQGTIVDEGPLCVTLEKCCIDQNVKKSPELVVSDRLVSPCLTGVFHPQIIIL